ncbi:hypothetical protein FRB99_008041, partial [Tulasnella sp. 403]
MGIRRIIPVIVVRIQPHRLSARPYGSMTDTRDIQKEFLAAPRFAVVGASKDEGKIGSK